MGSPQTHFEVYSVPQISGLDFSAGAGKGVKKRCKKNK